MILRPWLSGFPSMRPSPTLQQHPSVWSAGRNCRSNPAPCSDGTWPSDLSWRGVHQALGENRLASGQARRAGGCRSRYRTGLSFTICPSKLDVGRGPGHQGAAGRKSVCAPLEQLARTPGRSLTASCLVPRRERSSRRSHGIVIHGNQESSAGRIGGRTVSARQQAC